MNIKSKKGFTLIELIIVIAILGIIALIAVPNLAGIRQRSQVSADIRTAEQIGKSIRIWATDADAESISPREIPTKETTPPILYYAYSDINTGEGFVEFAGVDYYVGVNYVANSLGTSTGTPTYFVSSIGEGINQKIIVGIADLAADNKTPVENSLSLTYMDGAIEKDITKAWIEANKYNGSAPGWAYVEQ